MKRKIYEEIAVKLCELEGVLIVGSFPLYYLFPHKKLQSVDDLDAVISGEIQEIQKLFSIPHVEMAKLKDERLVYGRSPRISVREYPGHVFNTEFFYNGRKISMCIFPDSTVNIIKVDGKPLDIHSENGNFLIPQLGIFYITRLHPYAITQKRVENTSLVINNRKETPSELAYVSRDALKKAILEYKIELEQIKKARNIGTNRRDDPFKEYMILTYDINFLTSRVY